MHKVVIRIAFLLLLLLPSGAEAQQNVGNTGDDLPSPIINDNSSVTFRLYAPKAKDVRVIGDWSKDTSGAKMVKGRGGIWSFSTDSLASEMYTYRYVVDGMTIIDPGNPFARRDVGSLFSIFFIDGGTADNYQVHDVPHGKMTEVWYHSDRLGMDRRMQVYTPPFYDHTERN